MLSRIEEAFAEWGSLLGEKRVLQSQEAAERFAPNTEGISRQISGALYAESTEEVVAIVKIANRHKVPLYPISGGKNWGYGSALPVADGCVILDLSRMNRILDFDKELGIITIEPGVTQEQLHKFLKSRKADYIAPVTDAGPEATIVGTALERGLTITSTPFLFDSVTTLEAVLPDGGIYRPVYSEWGCEEADKAFKWGIGPYLDGLFTQSNFGIVTRLTLALPKKPERAEPFFFQLEKDEQLEKAIDTLRTIRQVAGGNMNYLSLIDSRYALAMAVPFPHDQVPNGKVIPEKLLNVLRKKNGIGAWMGGGALYGPALLIEAIEKFMQKALRSTGKKLTFLTPDLMKEIKRSLPPERVRSFQEIIEHLLGKSTDFPLKLAYWKSRNEWKEGKSDPAKDRAGILWYSPVIPLKGKVVRAYVDMARKICAEYGIEPLFTLVIADTCLFGIIPILFDSEDLDEVKRAHACFEALFKRGEKKGYLPYRVPVQFMHLIADPSHSFWRLASRIKDAVDPNNILAPGRYCPSERKP